MGIFSRIGDVLKANINDMIDRAEDPEKMVKQIILDLFHHLFRICKRKSARQHRRWARQWQASALQSGSMRMP